MTPAGILIRKHRREREMTRAELAERLEMSSSNLCRIEAGVQSVKVEQLAVVIDALGLTWSQFWADGDAMSHWIDAGVCLQRGNPGLFALLADALLVRDDRTAALALLADAADAEVSS